MIEKKLSFIISRVCSETHLKGNNSVQSKRLTDEKVVNTNISHQRYAEI